MIERPGNDVLEVGPQPGIVGRDLDDGRCADPALS
jgi:hypothetical protein